MTTARTAVVGGGIIGTAVARELLRRRPGLGLDLLEAEPTLAAHQTGRNSGVVHAGLYYPPGSLKATLCRRGVGLLREYCAENGLPFRAVGKVLVAVTPAQVPRLDAIAERARANGVPDIRLLDPLALAAVEPHVVGLAGLHSPSTAITDYGAVTRRLAADVAELGGTVRTSCPVLGLRSVGTAVAVRLTDGEHRYDQVVLCAGVGVDRLAAAAGDDPEPRLVPFRGEYHLLRPGAERLVRGLVYPVPDPRYPFLGVHLTPRVDGAVLVGPNALLAGARDGYTWGRVSPWDLVDTVARPGFVRFAAQHWRTGVTEMLGSLSTRRFVTGARAMVPELTAADLRPGTAGIRAQALDRDGTLVDDFRLTRTGPVLAVRNAPSPAATSSLAIAEHVVDLLLG